MMDRISFINICADRFTHADRKWSDLSPVMVADKPTATSAKA